MGDGLDGRFHLLDFQQVANLTLGPDQHVKFQKHLHGKPIDISVDNNRGRWGRYCHSGSPKTLTRCSFKEMAILSV